MMSNFSNKQYKKILDNFYDLEVDKKLFDIRIFNKFFWDYVRYDIIFNELKKKYSTIKFNKTERTITSKFSCFKVNLF